MVRSIGLLVATLLSATFLVSGSALAGGLYDGDYKGGSYKDGGFTGQAPKYMYLYSGVDFTRSSSFFYTGAIVSLNRNIEKSGMVFRGFAGYGDYDYSDQTLGPIDGDMTLIDAMIGYMFVRDSGSLAIYIGGEYQNHDLTPDDIANQIRGSEYGFKVAADISAARNGFYFELGGSYSTAFDSYYSQARIGLDRKRFVIGPEAGASGNKDYDAQRVGGFLTLKRHLNAYVPFDITLSGGYQFVSDGEGGVVSGTRGSQGGYGAVNFTATF